MKTLREDVLVVAPHPDDETLGCGGTILRHVKSGDRVHWLIATCIDAKNGWPKKQVAERAALIREVAKLYGFASVVELGLPTTRLDAVPKAELVGAFAAAFKKIRPSVVYAPHPGDAHSDHAAVLSAVSSCSKWFRAPGLRRVLAYETLSETGFGLAGVPFKPDHFVGIEAQLEEKIKILKRYGSELGSFPFPRSVEAVRALAATRGATAGLRAAEAFQLLRERVPA